MDIRYAVESSKSFDDTVATLKTTLAAHQFGVLWELNFKDKLREKGFEFEANFLVMEACNPGKAKKVLDRNIDAGYFLPCKVVVYEKESKVFIGMLRPTFLIELMDDPALLPVAEEVEAAIAAAMEEAR